MKTITFYENKYEDNHLMLCGIYACKAGIRCRLHCGDMQLRGDW